jgi:hypothetical protein
MEVIMTGNVRTFEARRTYVARDTAHIGTIQRKIEELFDLPPGCVRICHPSGRKVNSNSLVKSLRKKYGITNQ